MMTTNLASLRQNYALRTLSERDVDGDPFRQFDCWFQEALDSQILEPNAFTLATSTPDGKPAARTVLLKDFSPEGFVFYTNYESRKSRELTENPQAAMLFTWLDLQRQIRIEGSVERVGVAESEAYFQSRPRGSQLGAWASPQSRPVSGREELEARQTEQEAHFAGVEKLPVPPFWGGYRLKPVFFEFWQGRESRLHDRIVYAWKNNHWEIGRLAP